MGRLIIGAIFTPGFSGCGPIKPEKERHSLELVWGWLYGPRL